MRYPVAYGWEPWLCYKALSLNFKVRSFPDLVTDARPTSLTSMKARELGKSMKGLGYDVKYTLGRVALIFLRGYFKASLAMLQGYLSNIKRLDVADWVSQHQKRTFWKRLKGNLNELTIDEEAQVFFSGPARIATLRIALKLRRLK